MKVTGFPYIVGELEGHLLEVRFSGFGTYYYNESFSEQYEYEFEYTVRAYSGKKTTYKIVSINKSSESSSSKTTDGKQTIGWYDSAGITRGNLNSGGGFVLLSGHSSMRGDRMGEPVSGSWSCDGTLMDVYNLGSSNIDVIQRYSTEYWGAVNSHNYPGSSQYYSLPGYLYGTSAAGAFPELGNLEKVMQSVGNAKSNFFDSSVAGKMSNPLGFSVSNFYRKKMPDPDDPPSVFRDFYSWIDSIKVIDP